MKVKTVSLKGWASQETVRGISAESLHKDNKSMFGLNIAFFHLC